jgi:hypothetical protein
VSKAKPKGLKRQDEQAPPPQSKEILKKGTPQDVASERAKASRHKKVTADKWNQ